MRSTFILTASIALGFFLVLPATAVTLHVPGDYANIQSAIWAATDGDTVLIAPGTYTGPLNYNIDFSGKNIVVMSSSGPESCIIDADSQGGGFAFGSGESSDAKLIGIQMLNVSRDYGGAIIIENSSRPTIENCIMNNCSAGTGGGGICIIDGSLNITDCWIRNCHVVNDDQYGAGIYCQGNLLITDCILEDCSIAGDYPKGGGIYLCDSPTEEYNVTITDCEISNLTGAAIYADERFDNLTLEISGCTMRSGYAPNSCGGIHLINCETSVTYSSITYMGGDLGASGSAVILDNSHAEFINCTITQNNSWTGGSSVYLRFGSTAEFINTIFWDLLQDEIHFEATGDPNTATVAYCDVHYGENGIVINGNGTLNWQEGNIDADPNFVSPTYANWQLQPGSPCIDTGTDFFLWEGDTLVSLTPEQYCGEAPDMGAHESDYQPAYDETEELPSECAILTAYPNPFNQGTAISLQHSVFSHVNLSVYDIKGEKVAELMDRWQPPGLYERIFNAMDLSSGIFFVKLTAGDVTATQKLLLIR